MSTLRSTPGVRGRGWPFLSVLPVFLASLVLASLMLPTGREDTLHLMKYLAAPAELTLVGILIHRATRAVRLGRAHGSTDAQEKIRSAVHGVSGRRLAVRLRRLLRLFELSLAWPPSPES